MLNHLIKYAEAIKNKHKFGIDCGEIDKVDFFRTKLLWDKMKEQQLCSNLYKKIKKWQ